MSWVFNTMQEIPLTSVPLVEIKIGQKAECTRTITDSDIKAYASLSGDINPVHLDEDYASKTNFGRRVAHGMMSVGFFSALFGTRLPGPGCIYVSQNIQFKRPVFLGDTIQATIKVTDIDLARKRVAFETNCYVGDTKVISGCAVIYIP